MYNTKKKKKKKKKGSCLKEWTKLQNALRKSESSGKMSKDVRSGQDKCSKIFNRLELLIQRMNELEMENHEQSVELVKHFYETVMQQSQRLVTHYAYGQKYIASFQRWCDQYEELTKLSSVPSKDETLWKLVCFPTRHFPKLPCSSERVKNNMNPDLPFDHLQQRGEDDKAQLSRHLILPAKFTTSSNSDVDKPRRASSSLSIDRPSKSNHPTHTRKQNSRDTPAQTQPAKSNANSNPNVNASVNANTKTNANANANANANPNGGKEDSQWFGDDDKWFSGDQAANQDDGWRDTFNFDEDKEKDNKPDVKDDK
ncbi:conserved uncharacterized protein YfgA, partial [Reticulomyxa filosa]